MPDFMSRTPGPCRRPLSILHGMFAERAQRINRVVVPEQQHWLAVGLAGEVNLQTVAEIVAAMELRASAERFELGREECGDAVDRWLVVAGGFDLDEFANRFDYLGLMFREIAQAIGPRGLRFCWLFPGHNSLCWIATRRECNAVQYNLQAD